MAEWELAQREQAKNHTLIGVAVCDESSYSHKLKFSGTGEGAGESLRAIIESVSGVSLPRDGFKSRALTREYSGSSLASGTPDEDGLTYGSRLGFLI
jgi:hypothetical protein